MGEHSNSQNNYSQEESFQVLIVKLETTENRHMDATMRIASLEFENENLRQQQAKLETRIAELESQVKGLQDVNIELGSDIHYLSSGHCKQCGGSL